MTVVVADSSPLNYLVLIGSIDVLHRLYASIFVPQQVVVELTDPAAPREVGNWARTLPDWVEVRSIPPKDASATSKGNSLRSSIVLPHVAAQHAGGRHPSVPAVPIVAARQPQLPHRGALVLRQAQDERRVEGLRMSVEGPDTTHSSWTPTYDTGPPQGGHYARCRSDSSGLSAGRLAGL